VPPHWASTRSKPPTRHSRGFKGSRPALASCDLCRWAPAVSGRYEVVRGCYPTGRRTTHGARRDLERGDGPAENRGGWNSRGMLEEVGDAIEVREDGGPGSHQLASLRKGRGRGRPAWPEVSRSPRDGGGSPRVSSSNDPLLSEAMLAAWHGDVNPQSSNRPPTRAHGASDGRERERLRYHAGASTPKADPAPRRGLALAASLQQVLEG
jgi:hypothetical protein